METLEVPIEPADFARMKALPGSIGGHLTMALRTYSGNPYPKGRFIEASGETLVVVRCRVSGELYSLVMGFGDDVSTHLKAAVAEYVKRVGHSRNP